MTPEKVSEPVGRLLSEWDEADTLGYQRGLERGLQLLAAAVHAANDVIDGQERERRWIVLGKQLKGALQVVGREPVEVDNRGD